MPDATLAIRAESENGLRGEGGDAPDESARFGLQIVVENVETKWRLGFGFECASRRWQQLFEHRRAWLTG